MSALAQPDDPGRFLWDQEAVRIRKGAATLPAAPRAALRGALESLLAEADLDPYTADSARLSLVALGPRGAAGPAESPVTRRDAPRSLSPWKTTR